MRNVQRLDHISLNTLIANLKEGRLLFLIFRGNLSGIRETFEI